MTTPTRVHCWAGPRSGTTCLMYSWGNRRDVECFDEPLYAHHLALNPQLQRPYRAELLALEPHTSGQAVLERLRDRPTDRAITYAKHIAKQAQNLDLSAAVGRGQKHVVLIRNPLSMLLSWAAKTAEGVHGDCSLEELSLPQLLSVFSFLRRSGGSPVVVDYDDITARPRETLTLLCAALGVPFDEAMLRWEAGPKPFDGLWAPHWYASAHRSTGFARPPPRYRNLPPELLEVLREAMPFYELLRRHALRPGAAAGAAPLPAVLDHGAPRSLYPDERNLRALAWVGARGRGGLVPREMARVSAFDSAVQGGDAVWEGLRVYRGRVFKLRRHLRRLFASARALAFREDTMHTEEEVVEAVFQTLAANGMRDGVHIRLTLTRGEKTTSSMNPKFNAFGTTLIVLAEWKPVESVATYDNTGVRLVTAATRRNPPSCLDSKIHHCNLLNNILAKAQANLAGAADALMLDLDGFVSETNATNVFAVVGGALVTPWADACLPGVTRETVIRLAAGLGIPCEERRVSLAEFHAADEAFTTGTMGELSPVLEIDGRPIGWGADQGRAGPVTRRLQAAYRDLPDAEDDSTVVLPDFPAL